MSRYLFTLEDDVRLLRETLDQVLCTLDDPDNTYYTEMKLRAAERLYQVRDRLSGRAEQGYGQVKKVACWTDTYLHHKPWQSIGMSTAAGIAFGFVLARCALSD